jgi:hypothetical protein
MNHDLILLIDLHGGTAMDQELLLNQIYGEDGKLTNAEITPARTPVTRMDVSPAP